jgi:hypothetical protein
MATSGLESVVEARRTNAVLAWVLVGVLLASAAGGLITGDLVWVALTAGVAALAVLPAARFRDARAMLPWEVLLLAALPVLSRLLVAGVEVFGVTLTGRVSTYFAVAAVALIVAVELDVFTPVRMSHTFAVFFVAIATMAAAGVWAVSKWVSDIAFGTAFYPPPTASEAALHAAHEALMWDFVAATAIGLLGGLLFEWYFRRWTDTSVRIPDAVEREIADQAEELQGGSR